MKLVVVTRAPDDPDGTVWELAPADIAVAIQRRFDERPVVHHLDIANVFIFDPGNFWDGPTHVHWEPDTGFFWFDGWDGREHFPMVGPLR